MKPIFSLICVLFASAVFAMPMKVLIIRHAEKPADPNAIDLAPKGFRRAQALTHLFEIHPEYADPILPTEIFAFKYIPGQNSKRGIETITPLAQSLGLPVQALYTGEQPDEMANELITNSEHNHQIVMIAWKHSTIAELAAKLGAPCGKTWSDSVFDRVWILDFSGPQPTCVDKPESVLPGDSQ
jgi:hypothetical protein